MTDDEWFVFRPEKAQAFGRPTPQGFLVRKGSTAMVRGSPAVKRDRQLRDRLVRDGVLVLDGDKDLYVFSRDYEFTSASPAAGVVKDGNSSGPQQWIHTRSRKSLKDTLGAT